MLSNYPKSFYSFLVVLLLITTSFVSAQNDSTSLTPQLRLELTSLDYNLRTLDYLELYYSEEEVLEMRKKSPQKLNAIDSYLNTSFRSCDNQNIELSLSEFNPRNFEQFRKLDEEVNIDVNGVCIILLPFNELDYFTQPKGNHQNKINQ